MKEYMGQGTLTLSVSHNILGNDIENALERLNHKLNDLATQEIIVKMLSDLGEVNDLKVLGFSLDWEEINEVEKKQLKPTKKFADIRKVNERSMRSQIVGGKITNF